MRIQHTHKQEWQITENNAIGPTTSMTLRTLDNPTPDPLGSDSVWLAPNGNDANFGDQANPVLTLEYAIDLIQATPARNTIHVVRNGYVGDLVFILEFDHNALSGDILPFQSIIQAELGEAPTIRVINFGAIYSVEGRMNGFFIQNESKEVLTQAIVRLPGGGFSFYPMKWCSFYTLVNTGPKQFFNTTNGHIVNTIFNMNLMEGASTAFSLNYAGTGTLNIENVIVVNNLFNYAIQLVIDKSSTITILFNHCVFSGNQYVAFINRTGGPGTFTDDFIEFKNSIFANNGVEFLYLDEDYNLVIHNCLNTKEFSFSVADGIDNSLLVKDIYDNLIGVSPLFFNQLGGDFRLMDQRRKAPDSDQYFSFTSKAVYNPSIGQVPGDDTRDLGPYDVSYTLISDTWADLVLQRTELSEGIKITHKLSNYQEYKDARGNQHRAFDPLKRDIELNLNAEDFVGTKRSFEFVQALKADGAKRWYPNDDTGLFSMAATITALPGGQYQAYITGLFPYLVDHYYEGWICKLEDGSSEWYFRIVDNYLDSLNNTVIVLEDHRGTQSLFTVGDYQLTCQYLAVEFAQDAMDMNFPLWTGDGNALYPETYYITTRTSEKFEGHITKLHLYEAEADV